MKKFTVASATLLLFTTQAVHAETAQETTTVQPTTAVQTTQSPEATTETTQAPRYQTREVAEETPKESTYTGLVYENGNTFYHVNGKALLSQWKWANGRWYYFDDEGKMMTSGMTPDGYLVDAQGKIANPGWLNANGTWYYALEEGKVFRGDWKKIGGTWYAFHADGRMYAGEWSGNYFLKTDGAMADNEWVFDKNYNSWFYIKPGGIYARNEWKGDYYLKGGGYMAKSEFIYDPNYKATYYLKEDGSYARNQWLLIKGKWYHFRKYGELDTNKWIGSYYVKADGMMAENEWIYDKNYSGYFYLKEDGVYVTNIFTIDGKKHAFQDNGLWIAEVPAPVNYGNYKNVVFLDPGHGGRDPGAVYNGLREKDLNMSIYRKLRSELEKLGYTVLTSRDSDVYVDYVTERSEMVNKTDADVFISIHFNATGVPGANRSGVETYIYEPDPDITPRINKVAHDDPTRLSESKRLADNIHNSVVSVAGANDRGVRGSNYAVLRETVKPAVLLELGYIDSPEYKKISDDKYQNKLVEGIVKGLRNFYKTAK